MTLYVDSLPVISPLNHGVEFNHWSPPSVQHLVSNLFISVGSKIRFRGKIFSELYSNVGKANFTLERDDNDQTITGLFL